jgi:hypothetical protein
MRQHPDICRSNCPNTLCGYITSKSLYRKSHTRRVHSAEQLTQVHKPPCCYVTDELVTKQRAKRRNDPT